MRGFSVSHPGWENRDGTGEQVAGWLPQTKSSHIFSQGCRQQLWQLSESLQLAQVLLPFPENAAHASPSPKPVSICQRGHRDASHGDEADRCYTAQEHKGLQRRGAAHTFVNTFPSLIYLLILHPQLLLRSPALPTVPSWVAGTGRPDDATSPQALND